MNEPEGMVGGSFDKGVKVGFSYLDFTGSGFKQYFVGACDNLWSNLSGLRYALYGGRCDNGTNCGTSYLNVNNTPENANWNVGACLSFCF